MGYFILKRVAEVVKEADKFDLTEEELKKKLEELGSASDGAIRTMRKNRVLPNEFIIVAHSRSIGYEVVTDANGNEVSRSLKVGTRHFDIAVEKDGPIIGELYFSTLVTPQVDEINGTGELVGANGTFNLACIAIDRENITVKEKYEKAFKIAQKAQEGGKKLSCESIAFAKSDWGRPRFTYKIDLPTD